MKKIVWILAALLAAWNAQAGEPAISASPDDAAIEWGPCPGFFPEGCEIAVLHGDPAQPNADIYFRIPGGTAFPAHWHTSAERMVLVSGELDVTYEGQDTTHLKTGMYAYGPPEAVHDGACISDEACVLVIAFEQPVDAFLHEE
ncbi:MAG: cupin domain-containing protein [Wenzhouxiangellaceae bacterium]|nr:cupin domain-containing protein [Wenzhouxiangellaceae bacterium]